MKKIKDSFNIIKSILIVLALVLFLVPSFFVIADTTYSYVPPEKGLLLDKTVSETGTYDSLGREIHKLNLSISSSPEIEYVQNPYDIVIVVDTSGSIADLMNDYQPITSAPVTSETYYAYVNGEYLQLTRYSSTHYRYTYNNITYYVRWSSADNSNDPGTAGSITADSAPYKPYYTKSWSSSRMDATKQAINNFLQTVHDRNTNVRVSVVEFNGQTNYSVSNDILNSSGLNPIDTGGVVNPIFANNINNLIAGGTTHSNTGLGHAYSILNSQSNNSTREKIVILFTDGEPGTQGFNNVNGYGYAAAAINQANQLKAGYDSITSSNYTFNGYNSNNTYSFTHKTTTGSDAVTNGRGLGAKVYTIGLYNVGVAVDPLMVDYMQRVSSNYNSNNTSVGSSYYSYATSAVGLNTAFQNIAQNIPTPYPVDKTYSNIAIKDYIDPKFQIVNQTGTALNVGQTITVDGETGTIKEDSKGIYIEWNISTLTPGYITDGGGYACAAYIIAKNDFLGGNTVTTNVANISGVYNNSGTNLGSFPNPTVNVPFNFNVYDKKEYIILGQYLPYNINEAGATMYSSPYNIPSTIITYSFNENFSTDTLISEEKNYTATVTANATDYIDFSDTGVWTPLANGTGYVKNTGEIYKKPIGVISAPIQKTATYTVKPITPTFSLNSRTIIYGDAVGVNLKDLINIDIAKPTDIRAENWTRLNNELAGYQNSIFATYTSNKEPTPRGNTDLAAYVPEKIYQTASTPFTLNASLSLNDIQLASNLQPNIFIIPFQISITKTLYNTTDTGNQTFIFYIYKDSQLVTKIALKGGETAIIGHLKSGRYTIKEARSWSWRYSPTGNNPRVITAGTDIISQGSNNGIGTFNNGLTSVNFINSKVSDKWQGSNIKKVNKLVNGIWVGE